MLNGRPVSKTSPSSSTRKKVVVRKLDGDSVKGYVDSGSPIGPEGARLLDRDGRLTIVPLDAIKGIYFVRDFEGDPDRPERKVFLSRPRLSGIWIRMTFKDNEVMEGLMANNLLESDSSGFLVMPPDFSSNNLKVFVPRAALGSVEVLGVISDGSARRALDRARRPRAKVADKSAQIDLFAPAGEPSSG
jgi:hypothetical protein